MGLSNNEILIRLGIVMAFVVMLPGLLLFLLGLEPGTLTRVKSEPREIAVRDRAMAIARVEYAGRWNEFHSEHTTMGELKVVECSPLGALVSTAIDFARGNLNWCDPNLDVWVVDFEGEFWVDGAKASSLSLVLDGKGKLVRMGASLANEAGK